ncbi:GH3 auxin-responsive promoter family protein [Porphyromonas loveana]|uniref:GH3 auxin-responsive promoter family protein n=1 Tax=Porphyromonas loveana TaxID=1884669 RepID=UPI0035A0E35C
MDYRTRIISTFTKSRLRAIDSFAHKAAEIQHRQLMRILSRATDTVVGNRYRFGDIESLEAFARQVPIHDYESLQEEIELMLRGSKDVLCPGRCLWFAKSSGTTNSKSKFIPVPADHLHDCHYQGSRDTLWLYLRNRPDSRFFATKALVLGGSHSSVAMGGKDIKAGDLSAILVENMPWLGNSVRVPSKQTLLMSEWTEKMQAVIREVAHARVGSLSGVPSWMLVMIKELLAAQNCKTLSDLWPELEVFFHGGISFSPYKAQYEKLIPSSRMQYMETYNASEGFFAIQDDPQDSGMLLMLDYGVYYEFVPMDTFGSAHAEAVPLEGVDLGRNYAMLISTLGGLYRYVLGDTVRFTSLHPYKIVITGRTKHYINAFGEELMVDNADKALASACKRCGAQIVDYTAAPHFFPEEGKGRHDWLIEFAVEPTDPMEFARVLDAELQQLNSDYEAKRYADMTLLPLSLTVARRGLFHDWLAEQGKLGGQHKIPRLSNTPEIITSILEMNSRPYTQSQ